MSNDSDALGDRMKRYEEAARLTLPPRLPVLIRVDGKAFHTFTRGCQRPFDADINAAMVVAAKALCGEIQGAQLAFVQSDEISVLVHGYKRHSSQPWLKNQTMKMASVSAATAAGFFTVTYGALSGRTKVAAFDGRAWAMPEADVCNYFLWRQQDATRNSIQMLARSLYSHKECHLRNTSQLQEMCFAKGHNWNDLPTRWRRGTCVVRVDMGDGRPRWAEDAEIPIFSQRRDYIERLLTTEDESGEEAAA